jgi:hypothetical protein
MTSIHSFVLKTLLLKDPENHIPQGCRINCLTAAQKFHRAARLTLNPKEQKK